MKRLPYSAGEWMGFYEFFSKNKTLFLHRYQQTAEAILEENLLKKKVFSFHDNKIDLILSFFLFSCARMGKNLDNTEKKDFFLLASISSLHILPQILFFKVVPCVVKNKHFSLTLLMLSLLFVKHQQKIIMFYQN